MSPRKKANIDLGETGEFNQRRIYDDQNTFDLLRVASEVLGEYIVFSYLFSVMVAVGFLILDHLRICGYMCPWFSKGAKCEN